MGYTEGTGEHAEDDDEGDGAGDDDPAGRTSPAERPSHAEPLEHDERGVIGVGIEDTGAPASIVVGGDRMVVRRRIVPQQPCRGARDAAVRGHAPQGYAEPHEADEADPGGHPGTFFVGWTLIAASGRYPTSENKMQKWC